MVVVSQGLGASASGLINLATLGFSVQINRVESQSQAVRNLIEVGMIELLGRHAGVPYWTCLAAPNTSAQKNGKRERAFVRQTDAKFIDQAKDTLTTLGYLSQTVHEDGLGPLTRDAISRFQADQKVLPNGIVDFDLITLLKRRAAHMPKDVALQTIPIQSSAHLVAKPVLAPKTSKIPTEERGIGCATSSPTKPCDTGYINLYDYLKKQ
jgi:hypothetical protein